VDKSVSPTKSMCKSVLGLIGDLADCIGVRIQAQLQLQFVETLILMLRASNESESQDVSNWAYKKIRQSLGTA
jgi:hypothetical protein